MSWDLRRRRRSDELEWRSSSILITAEFFLSYHHLWENDNKYPTESDACTAQKVNMCSCIESSPYGKFFFYTRCISRDCVFAFTAKWINSLSLSKIHISIHVHMHCVWCGSELNILVWQVHRCTAIICAIFSSRFWIFCGEFGWGRRSRWKNLDIRFRVASVYLPSAEVFIGFIVFDFV
jgi:hypothetical protein